jgi:hypothetical protein
VLSRYGLGIASEQVVYCYGSVCIDFYRI